MKVILAERRWATFQKEHVQNSTARLLQWGGSAGGWMVPIWGQHGDSILLFSFQEHRRLQASLCTQNLFLLIKLSEEQGQRDLPGCWLRGIHKQQSQARVCKCCNNLSASGYWKLAGRKSLVIKVVGKHFTAEVVDSVTKWTAALTTFNVDHSWHKPEWYATPTATCYSIQSISLHPHHFPSDVLMHPQAAYNLLAWLWVKGKISPCLANLCQAGRRPDPHTT